MASKSVVGNLALSEGLINLVEEYVTIFGKYYNCNFSGNTTVSL
jgi:hypothetical protein